MDKPSFPSKPCPKCGKYIHARMKKHEECGWVMEETAARRPKGKKTPKVRQLIHKPAPVSGTVTLADIQAVKALTDRLGAEKVWQLAAVLGK